MTNQQQQPPPGWQAPGPQQHWGQGPTGANQPQQPYGQPNPYQAPQQPYGQPNPYLAPQQGYGQPNPYQAPVKAPRSPVLGSIALAMVVVCGVVLSYTMWKLGAPLGEFMLRTGPGVTQAELQVELTKILTATDALLINVGILGGTIGWILGIVAAATRRGRGYGITAIILGILAPIIAIIVMAVAIAPYVS